MVRQRPSKTCAPSLRGNQSSCRCVTWPVVPPRWSKSSSSKTRRLFLQQYRSPRKERIWKKLEANVSAIAYLSSVLALQSDKLKVFNYEGVEPGNDNVVAGK